MSDNKKQQNPLLQALVLILTGLIFSYTGAFYLEGTSSFAWAMIVLGIVFPLWAMRILWMNRNKL